MEWKVRYIDYPKQFRKLEDELMPSIRTVLANGDLILRKHTRDFEEHLAEFVGTGYAVGLNSGTDALELALYAAGIGPGDEVITVSHTFVATASSIYHVGAKPVLVDIGDDHNMNVGLVEEAITERTKAIIPVHLNGRVCSMRKLMAIAEAHNLVVIEDACQSLGGSFEGTKAGAFGLAGCFSFYPAKILGAYGDAGALVTNSKEFADKIKMLRDHGRTPSGELGGWAFNARLDNIQAAILDIKFKYLPDWIARRRWIAQRYHEGLSGIPELRLPPAPTSEGPYFDVFQNYEIEAENRDGLVAHLRQQGVEIMITWGGKAVHQFQALGLSGFNLPRTEELFRKVLMIPMHPELTDSNVDYVIQAIRDFYGH